MFMSFKYIAAASALFATTAAMAGTEEQRVTRDGQTFVYTTTTHDDGRTVIAGRHLSGNGGKFRLVVRKGYVTGQSNGMPVSFRVTDAAGAAAVPQILASK